MQFLFFVAMDKKDWPWSIVDSMDQLLAVAKVFTYFFRNSMMDFDSQAMPSKCHWSLFLVSRQFISKKLISRQLISRQLISKKLISRKIHLQKSHLQKNSSPKTTHLQKTHLQKTHLQRQLISKKLISKCENCYK